jgi:membrane protease YdiL (CAAX protease family)
MPGPGIAELTTAFDHFVQPGAARPGLWRLFVGLALILLVWVLWTSVVLGAVALANLLGGLTVEDALDQMRRLTESKSPVGVILALLTLAGIWPGVWLALRLLHGQGFRTLLSPRGRMRWGEFSAGLAISLGFWAVTILFATVAVGLPERTHLPLGLWLPSLSPLVVLVFLQASGEELIFRGYILQQLASRYRSPLIWGFLPSFLFGLMHYENGAELGVGWHYVAVTTLFGVAAAAMVWRTGSLAAAMGVHSGMNLFTLSFAGVEGIIEGTQLFIFPGAEAPTLFLADGLATLLLVIFVLSPYFPLGRRAAS